MMTTTNQVDPILNTGWDFTVDDVMTDVVIPSKLEVSERSPTFIHLRDEVNGYSEIVVENCGSNRVTVKVLTDDHTFFVATLNHPRAASLLINATIQEHFQTT
jgi:hypothetical protein